MRETWKKDKTRVAKIKEIKDFNGKEGRRDKISKTIERRKEGNNSKGHTIKNSRDNTDRNRRDTRIEDRLEIGI